VQTRNDGKHDILPAAAFADRAGLPVMMLRRSDGKVRRDGSSAALVQPQPPSTSAEDCTAHQTSHASRKGLLREAAKCCGVEKRRDDDDEKITGSTTD
jgi:hypothetical protein